MHNKFLGLALVLALVAIVASGVYFFWYKSQPKQSSTNQSPDTFKVENKDLPTGQLPQALGANLPVQAGSETLQSYESTTNDGRKQSTVIFSTKLTPQKAVEFYAKYFEAQGWKQAGKATARNNDYVVSYINSDDSLMLAGRLGEKDEPNSIEITLLQVNQ